MTMVMIHVVVFALSQQIIKGQIFNVLSDGYAYYEEWQHLVQKSDKEVKELLESFGTKCKNLGVCENNYFNRSSYLLKKS